MKNSWILARSLAQSFLPAAGGFFNRPDEWYLGLRKPAGNPPPAIFGPVWTALYTLMGLALYEYQAASSTRDKTLGQVFFDLQLALNAAWSPVFFTARSPRWALLTIVLLWVAIVATFFAFRKVSPRAAYLLVPYLAWVSFATYLNAGICVLNPNSK